MALECFYSFPSSEDNHIQMGEGNDPAHKTSLAHSRAPKRVVFSPQVYSHFTSIWAPVTSILLWVPKCLNLWGFQNPLGHS